MSENQKNATAPSSEPATKAEFGTLADLCMSTSLSARRDRFGEFSPIYLDSKKKTSDTDAMDKLSLSRSR